MFSKYSLQVKKTAPITSPLPEAKYVDVTWYGAVGDGSTDDTAAIQEALTDATEGSVVNFPASSSYYKITSALTVSKSLTLTGPGTIHQVTAGTKGIYVTASNVTIDGLTVTGPQYITISSGSIGIDVQGTFNAGTAPTYITDFTIRNCNINTWGDYGLRTGYINRFSFINNKIYNVYFTGIEVISNTNGIIANNYINNIPYTGVPGYDAYGIIITRATGDAGNLTSQPRPSSITVTGNVVTNVPTWTGIDTHSGNSITISGNVVKNCYFAIAVGSSKDNGGVNYVYAPLNIVVSGNSLDSTVTDGTYSSGITFSGSPTENATGLITGNLVKGYGSSTSSIDGGILFYYVNGLVVSGNTVLYPSPNGIVFNGGAIASTISGNTIIDPWTNSVVVAGVRGVLGTGDNNSVMVGDNSFYHVDKSATYILTVANGVGVRFSTGTNCKATVGVNHTNAFTPFTDSNSTAYTRLDPVIVSAPNLPTADPHVVGQIWRNSGIMTVSAG